MSREKEETKKCLILQLNDIFQALTSACDFVKTQKNLHLVQAKIHRIDDLKVQYDALRIEICKFNAQMTDSKAEISTKLDNFNVLFDAIYAKYFELSESKNNSTQSTSSNTNSVTTAINLQPLKLINFDGNIDKWMQFKSLFDSLVHNNNSIPIIQKLHYLKAHVYGEAASLIDNISLQEANYQLCYDILKERYSSTRRLVNFYVNQILNFNFKDAKDYGRFLSNHSNAVNGLKNLKLSDPLDTLLFHLCYKNLSSSDKQSFDNTCNPQEIPTTENLFNYLKRRVHTTELQNDSMVYSSSKNKLYYTPQRRNVSLVASKTNLTAPFQRFFCIFCTENHKIYWCPKFSKMSVSERNKWVSENKKCSKCLGNHFVQNCSSSNTCKECQSPDHHSLLHEKPSHNSIPQCCFTRSVKQPVLLGTLKLFVKNSSQHWVQVRCLVDSGSQVNLMSLNCANKLQLPISTSSGAISGVSGSLSPTQGELKCTIDLGNQIKTSNFVILKNICSPQPNFKVSANIKNKFKHLKLADDEFYLNSPIDLLLGADLTSQLISNIEPVFIPGEPSALRTHYGYVLVGKLDSSLFLEPTSLFISNENLNEELRKFWELENIQNSKFESPEDLYCENFFKNTFTRSETGRYQVRLPIKPNSKPLTSNRNTVYASYINFENRLLKNPNIKSQYDEFLKTYLELDYMEKAKTAAQYLHTHHAVFKDSSSTSMRVVINGSTPDSNGQSLNSILHSGPKLQASLPTILDHFRSYKHVIIADISKMFNQILIHPSDRKFQHIFWRSPQSELIEEYELKRLSFGHTSSPWLALRVLKQLVEDEGSSYPNASFALSNCTYIDDVITGSNSIESGKNLIKELTQLLEKGGFKLKKWISNSSDLLQNFSDSELELPRPFSDESSYFKVLGMTWLPKNDSFSFNISEFTGSITKRNILSFIARLFDPCGWCAPVTVKAKLFIQKTWLLKVDWDEELPQNLATKWSNFVKEFSLLSQIKIPRNISDVGQNYRLLGFCDGSTEAYGCCVYIQSLRSHESPCYLLRSKSKVCPLKTISIPRIELLAAHLLVKLIKSICEDNFPFKIKDIFYFTDSEVVLYWISSSPHQLKSFVANRITEIHELSSPAQWRHVSGHENPGDPISRGLSPRQLLDCDIYWNGPSFIRKPMDKWPLNPTLSSTQIPDLKPTQDCLNITNSPPFVDILSRYSTLTKLQNVFAYLRRFIHNCKYPDKRLTGPLTIAEQRKALQSCAYVTQRYYFQTEIQSLQKGNKIASAFSKLSPFFDATHLVRAGGRLQNSQLSYESKHPVLLPKKSHLSQLICSHYHLISLHSGVTTVQALIQKHWWIFSIRSLLRKIIFSCLKCYKLKMKPSNPFMADLPPARVRISRAFTHVGTDFCGPFTVKESNRRNAKCTKGYLCIFVCLSTKAVHLEMVSELTTAAFLACLDRFIARRSIPSCVYSDNGTNYVGASRQLLDLKNWLQKHHQEVHSALASRQIDWKFSPPNAPNFGGLWESVVKSAKTLMYRLIGEKFLTFEEYATVFSRIEAVLNSRPLTFLASSPDENLDYLSPGHFLVGGPLLDTPAQTLPDDFHPKTRWEMLQQLTQSFWNRWSSEYLHTLISRQKWQSSVKNIQIGDVVFVKKLNSTPLSWPIGRVIDVHPGKDGVNRVVTVKTSGGTYLRPTNTLIPLPIDQ